MEAFLFRRAMSKDLAAIIELLADDKLSKKREKLEEGHKALYQKAFDQIQSDQNQSLMVVEKEKEVIAMCHLTFMPSLTFNGAMRMNIEAVRVSSELRGQKVGEWMIKKAVAIATKKGCHIVQLTTNKKRVQAKKFYENLGFDATHEGMKLYLSR